MAENFLICRIDEPAYSKAYEIRGTELHGHSVNVYAECVENHDRTGDDDYYNLSLFFDADNYGSREFIIKVSFGNPQMTQQEIDAEVSVWIQEQVLDDILARVHRYLKKEELYEVWSEENS